jgi:hypothetical protein
MGLIHSRLLTGIVCLFHLLFLFVFRLSLSSCASSLELKLAVPNFSAFLVGGSSDDLSGSEDESDSDCFVFD